MKVRTIGLRECLERVVESSGFAGKRGRLGPGRGVGLAASAYISGAGLPIYWNAMPHSGVQIKVDRSGGVAVFCGSTDIGQGSDSVLAYVVAEELGIRPEDIRVVTADTDLTPVDLGSYSSRVTLMTGNAAIQAARRVRDQIFRAAAKKLEVPAGRLRAASRRVCAHELISCVSSPTSQRSSGSEWPLAVVCHGEHRPRRSRGTGGPVHRTDRRLQRLASGSKHH